MKELQLSNDPRTVLLDDEDYERLKEIKFQSRGKTKNTVGRCYTKHFYTKDGVFTKSKQVYQSLPNAVMQTENLLYDHVDKNPLNNQKNNLRTCTWQQNIFNQGKRKNSSSKYRGVYFDTSRGRRKCWLACIRIDGKKYHLGTFATEKEAAIAWNKKASEIHKEFASLNVVE